MLCPRKDHRGVSLISDVPFGRLWYGEPDEISNASAMQSFAVGHIAVNQRLN